MWQQLILAQSGGQGGGQIVPMLVMIAVICGIFWFLVIRPQKKRHEEHQDYLNSLKKGDDVVTAGGIFGSVDRLDGEVVTVRISRDTKVKVLRQQIEGSQASLLSDDDEQADQEDDQEDDQDQADQADQADQEKAS